MIHTHQISRDVEVNLNLFWDRVKYNCHLNKKNNWRFPNKHMCLWTFVYLEVKHRIIKFSDHDCIHNGVIVFPQV